MEVADRVAAVLRASERHCVYVHGRTGRDDEAMVALLAWAAWRPRAFPALDAAFDRWLFDRGLLQSTEEQRALLASALLAICSRATGGKGTNRTMDGFVTKRPRSKK